MTMLPCHFTSMRTRQTAPGASWWNKPAALPGGCSTRRLAAVASLSMASLWWSWTGSRESGPGLLPTARMGWVQPGAGSKWDQHGAGITARFLDRQNGMKFIAKLNMELKKPTGVWGNLWGGHRQDRRSTLGEWEASKSAYAAAWLWEQHTRGSYYDIILYIVIHME